MIRTVWATWVMLAATGFYGSIVLVASLFRVRGLLYSRCTQRWAEAILRATGVRVRVEGAEHVRPDTPQVIVSNHVSGYDIFALASVLPLPFAFVGKKELERLPFFGVAWIAAGHISIDRSNRQRALASLQEAARRIREERSTVIMFAEGTRSKSGELLPFKKGAFALAVESGAPVVPTVVLGTRGIRRGRWSFHPAYVTVRFGPPLTIPAGTAHSAESLMTETHGRMRQMLTG